MHTQAEQPGTTARTSRTSAVRLVSLRLKKSESELAATSSLFARSVNSFLESEIKPPFQYKKVTATAFALNGKCTPQELDDYIDDLQSRILEFLFGTDRDDDCDILFFSGSDVDVANFITMPENGAREMAIKFNRDRQERKRAQDIKSGRFPPAVNGKRELLYRGILLCPHKVLLSYAITPDAGTTDQENRSSGIDVNLGNYLEFRGDEAIDFSIRIFDKISYLLQTGGQEIKTCVLVVPIDYKSLLKRQHRDRFLENLKQHPDWVRQNMILSVFRCPSHPGSTILQKFAGLFGPLFRTIDWQVTDPDFNLHALTGCHFHSLTFDMFLLRPNQRQKALERFTRRATELKQHKIRAAVSGVETTEELLQCLASGIVYASGNAVTAPMKVFAPAQKVEIRDLPILEPTTLEATTNAA